MKKTTVLLLLQCGMLAVSIGTYYGRRFRKANEHSQSQSTDKNAFIVTDNDIVTTSEMQTLKKLSEQSVDELLSDETNPGALYILGKGLLQSGESEDQEAAYRYLEKSASLGFAPASYELWYRWVEKPENLPLQLAVVYLKLAVENHPGLESFYRGLYATIKQENGDRTIEKIESIAECKKKMIAQNQQLLEHSQEKKMAEIQTITDGDERFGYDYWSNLK